MAKHRKDVEAPEVLVTDLYCGTIEARNLVGKLVMTDGQPATLVFDERTVGRSVKKLLENSPVFKLNTSNTPDILKPQLPTDATWYNQEGQHLQPVYNPYETPKLF